MFRPAPRGRTTWMRPGAQARKSGEPAQSAVRTVGSGIRTGSAAGDLRQTSPHSASREQHREQMGPAWTGQSAMSGARSRSVVAAPGAACHTSGSGREGFSVFECEGHTDWLQSRL